MPAFNPNSHCTETCPKLYEKLCDRLKAKNFYPKFKQQSKRNRLSTTKIQTSADSCQLIAAKTTTTTKYKRTATTAYSYDNLQHSLVILNVVVP